MNFINERVCFFDVCESMLISIESIIISIFIFVIKRSNYKLLFNRFFQRIVRMNVVNMNNNLLKIMLHSLNDKKQISCLKTFAEHVSNKDKKFVFIFKTLNV